MLFSFLGKYFFSNKIFMKPSAKLILVFLLFIYSAPGFAQSFSKGIEAAVTTSTVKISDIEDKAVSAMEGDGIMGYEAGMWLRFKLAMLYIKPKVLLHYEEGKLNYTINNSEQSTSTIFSAGKILVPVLLGYKFIPVLGIEGGPVFNYVVFATKDFEGEKVDVQKSGIGYRIGLSAEIKILHLTVSYQGVKNNGSSTNIATYDSPNAFVFGVGLAF
jgi:hypothetical protein